MAIVLYKSRNAALGADRPTLRALLWRSAAALPSLPRAKAIACARRLAAKRHRNAEPVRIRLKGHSWAPFKADTDYFGPSAKSFMMNFRVDDLDALIEQLKSAGIELIGEPESHEYGKFAWIMDPDGIKIELWEPAGEPGG